MAIDECDNSNVLYRIVVVVLQLLLVVVEIVVVVEQAPQQIMQIQIPI